MRFVVSGLILVLLCETVYLNFQKKILGLGTVANVPCSIITDWQNKYCQTNQYDLINNGQIGVKKSQTIDGIIDLFTFSNNQWVQYNNIVPIARVNNIWNNSEINQSKITVSNIHQNLYKFEYTPLPNGAHFYLILDIPKNGSEVSFKVVTEPDSKPIEAFSLGNYFGLQDQIEYVRANSYSRRAQELCQPKDGNYILGDFYIIADKNNNLFNNKIKFSGNSKLLQYQSFDTPLKNKDIVMIEIRRRPWLPTQPDPGRNWIETVHLTREPLTIDNSIWKFGVGGTTSLVDWYPSVSLPCPH